jgi:hypothetical protein
MPIISNLVEELSNRLGLGAIEFGEANPLSLCFDGKFLVTLNHDANDHALILSATLSFDAPREEELRALLTSSCLGARTDGAAFGISPDTGELLLWKRWNDEFPDCSALEAALNRFLAQVEYWQQQSSAQAPSLRQDKSPALISSDNISRQWVRI